MVTKERNTSSPIVGAYQAVAGLCANQGATITAAPEATFSAKSGGTAYSTNQNWASYVSQNGWGGVAGVGAGPSAGVRGPSNPANSWGAQWSAYESITANPSWTTNSWASWVTAAPWTTNPSWTTAVGSFSTALPWGPGFNGYGGPFGGNWGNFQSSGAWTNGPWTAWWGNSACPASTWSGWTSGPWSTNAPWTTWAGCTATTTATSVITTTSSGSVMTSTSYGVRVAAVAAATSVVSGAASVASSAVAGASSVASNAASAVASVTQKAAAPTNNVVAGGALVAALFGAVVAL